LLSDISDQSDAIDQQTAEIIPAAVSAETTAAAWHKAARIQQHKSQRLLIASLHRSDGPFRLRSPKIEPQRSSNRNQQDSEMQTEIVRKRNFVGEENNCLKMITFKKGLSAWDIRGR
jgi:hypothetical protein